MEEFTSGLNLITSIICLATAILVFKLSKK